MTSTHIKIDLTNPDIFVMIKNKKLRVYFVSSLTGYLGSQHPRGDFWITTG